MFRGNNLDASCFVILKLIFTENKETLLKRQVSLVQIWCKQNTKGTGLKMQAIPHGNARYKWAAWADGKWRKFQHGKDFTCKPASFRIQVLAAARSMGVEAETRIIPGGVVAAIIYPKVGTTSVNSRRKAV